MRRGTAGFVLVALAALAGCAVKPQLPPINSVAFERRPPPPGQPGYLETIKYIDDGLRYTSPIGEFFVSPFGEMCFFGALVPGITPVLVAPGYWCMSPLAVNGVDAIENDISYVNQVRLWCQLATPQCAHRVGYPTALEPNWTANSITAETIPFQRQRAAIEYLVYLMGGNVTREQAMR